MLKLILSYISFQNHSANGRVTIATFDNKVKELEAVDAQLQGNLVKSFFQNYENLKKILLIIN